MKSESGNSETPLMSTTSERLEMKERYVKRAPNVANTVLRGANRERKKGRMENGGGMGGFLLQGMQAMCNRRKMYAEECKHCVCQFLLRQVRKASLHRIVSGDCLQVSKRPNI